MKILTLVLRFLLGALMLFASITYFFNIFEQPTPAGNMATVMAGFVATKYLLPLTKVVELIAGICLVTGKFMKVALLMLLPVSINIFLINTFVAPENFAIGAFVIISNLFLIFSFRQSYQPLFS